MTDITTEYVPILLSKRLCFRQKSLIGFFLLIFKFGGNNLYVSPAPNDGTAPLPHHQGAEKEPVSVADHWERGGPVEAGEVAPSARVAEVGVEAKAGYTQ